MSYQVLARKYRPKNFDTLVGQEHVVRALTHALQTQRLHHAYLFTGTRGVGKTTLSRILAKSFNCIGPDGKGDITATPCGVCEVCTAIDAGRFVDYIEMDAASNRGVDEMAQLLEQAVYAPSNARFKVYMIDEVHMLTNTAFNAMLKTLEEPPPHIKFILATTDPQKIPVTVLSRCLQFNLKQMPPGHIIGHLEHILGLEQIEFDTPALRLLAQGAHGSMRDALSLTDQAIAYAAGKVSLEAVQGMLGALDQSFLLRILDALAREDGADLLAVADEMATRSLSYNNALQDLASLLHQLALAQTVPQALAQDIPDREEVLRLAQCFDADEVQLFYQIAVHGRNELGLAPDEYAGFSMTLLRMLAFRPSAGAAQAAPPTASGAPSRASMPAAAAPAAVARAGAAASNPIHGPAHNPAQNPAHNPPPVQSAPSIHAPAARSGLSPAMAALQAARAAQAGGRPNTAPTASPATPTANVGNPGNPGTSAAARPEQPVVPQVSAVADPLGNTASVAAGTLGNTMPVPDKPATPVANNMPDDMPPWDDDGWSSDGAAEFFGAQLETRPETRPVQQRAAPVNPRAAAQAVVQQAAQSAAQAVAGNQTPPARGSASAANNQAISAALRIAQARANGTANSPSPVPKPEPQVLMAEVEEEKVAPPFVKTALPELKWDGDWPELATALPVRGIVQQLAWQSELIRAEHTGNNAQFFLRTPLQTLCSDGNIEKLANVLTDHFQQPIRLEIKVEGPVWHTANARAEAARLVRQKEAERIVQQDPFVQAVLAEFGGYVPPQSIKPYDFAQSAAN